MTFAAIQELLKPELQAVRTTLKQAISDTPVPLITEINEHLHIYPGKQIRASLCLLSAKFCEQKNNQIPLEQLAHGAIIIELIHSATLLHDDVIDQSETRRHQPTAHTKWGNAPAILVGDFLYAQAFEYLVNLKNFELVQLLAKTTKKLAETEIIQLTNKYNFNFSESEYFNLIHGKTALLFENATRIGCHLAQAPETIYRPLQAYAYHIGMAFQLIDDVLDYPPDAKILGKNPGDDWQEGRITLPIIHALQQKPTYLEKFKHLKTQNFDQAWPEVQNILSDTKSLEYTRETATKKIICALGSIQTIPSDIIKTQNSVNVYQEALIKLVHYILARTY